VKRHAQELVLTETGSTFAICTVLTVVRVRMVLTRMVNVVLLKVNVLVNIMQKHLLRVPPYKMIVTSGKLYVTYETVRILQSYI
jgi:hypothetical protein